MGKSKKTIVISEKTEVSTGYQPREHQTMMHLGLKRFNVLLCHRRLGKTVFALNVLIDKALRCKLPMPRYAYIAPTFAMAKRIAWDYLKAYTDKIPNVEYNEAELRADLPNGARIQLLSAENPMSLKGTYNDFVVLDEYALMNPIVWREAVRPTLSDRRGGCLFISTVKGMNHFWEMYEYARDMGDPEWFCANLKASETGIIPASELASARMTMTEEEYEQEYENNPVAGLVGAYFAKDIGLATRESRIGVVPHEPNLPVDLYFDLGMNDTTVAWFVQTDKVSHRMINYYEVSGSSIPETVKSIKEIAKVNNYSLDYWVLPHDAKVRDLSTGRARVQEFYNAGIKRVRIVPRVGSKMESINAARVMFKKCWFDQKNCAQGLKALANYQRKFDSKNNVFQETPLHNWASNGADAFQCFAMGVREDHGTGLVDGKKAEPSDLEHYAETEYNVWRV